MSKIIGPFDPLGVTGRGTPSKAVFDAFRKTVYDYYRRHGRTLPWRRNPEPFRVFVSEIMLQQTQVERVVQRFEPFIDLFPDFRSLAVSPLKDILRAWRGLGYNRRALFLKSAAETIMRFHGGSLPSRREELLALPGIGEATASSIMVFAYNEPLAFIETNVRTVFIHFFFPRAERVRDGDILPLVESALDRRNPRRWYNALMDYGSMMKQTLGNAGKKSALYKRQAPFRDSNRELRGRVLGALIENKSLCGEELLALLRVDRKRLAKAVAELKEEGFIREGKGSYRLA